MRLLVLALWCLTTAAFRIKVMSPTSGLLHNDQLTNGILIKHRLTRATIKVVFEGERIDYIESKPRARAAYKVYTAENTQCQDGYCTAYWMLGLLPSRRKTIPIVSWLKKTAFSDSTQDELQTWMESRLVLDHYTTFIIAVQTRSTEESFIHESNNPVEYFNSFGSLGTFDPLS